MTDVAVCRRCGQRGDQRPGLRLYDAGPDAVFAGEEAILAPQWLECLGCGQKELVPGGTVEVIDPRKLVLMRSSRHVHATTEGQFRRRPLCPTGPTSIGLDIFEGTVDDVTCPQCKKRLRG